MGGDSVVPGGGLPGGREDIAAAAAYAAQVGTLTRLKKVRGFLLMFAILHAIAYPLFLSMFDFILLSVPFTAPQVLQTTTDVVKWGSVTLGLVFITIMSLISGVMLWRKSESAVSVTKFVVLANLSYFSYLTWLTHGTTWGNMIIVLIYSAAVLSYLETSKRVKAVFGA